MKQEKKHNIFWLWSTIPIVILLAVATIAGVFNPNTYAQDKPFFATQGIAQDFISLFVTIPVMLVSFVFALRGSLRARLIWLGMIGYTLYSYILYAFFVRFNSLFLVYAGTLALTLYTLIGTIYTTDQNTVRDAVLANHENPAKFRRRNAIILFSIAGIFYLLWLSEIVPALQAGITPQSVLDNGLPTNPVHVLDLTFLLPGLVIVGILLLKDHPLTYVITPIFFGYAAMLGLAIIAMVILLTQQGYPVVIPQVVIFAMMTILNTIFLLNYTKGLGMNKVR
jgi:hypothetical protein